MFDVKSTNVNDASDVMEDGMLPDRPFDLRLRVANAVSAARADALNVPVRLLAPNRRALKGCSNANKTRRPPTPSIQPRPPRSRRT